jgi:hypothetical protein
MLAGDLLSFSSVPERIPTYRGVHTSFSTISWRDWLGCLCSEARGLPRGNSTRELQALCLRGAVPGKRGERARQGREGKAKGEPRTRIVFGGTRGSTPEGSSSGEAIQQQSPTVTISLPRWYGSRFPQSFLVKRTKRHELVATASIRFVLLLSCSSSRFCLPLPLPFIYQKGATKRGVIYTHKQILQ